MTMNLKEELTRLKAAVDTACAEIERKMRPLREQLEALDKQLKPLAAIRHRLHAAQCELTDEEIPL